MGSSLSRLIKQVRNTQEKEISCSECLDQVSQYVDLELTTRQAAEHMPWLKQHLDQCKVCREEYQVLRELALMELEGGLPTHQEMYRRLKNPAG